jgi:hypothetical protein
MNSNFPNPSTSVKTGLKFRHIATLLFLAFVGGIGLTAWIASQYGLIEWRGGMMPSAKTQTAIPTKPGPSTALPSPQTAPAPAPAMAPPAPVAGAATAIDTTNRSEAMMIAFAARRAIESGTSLGNITGQLQQRFGASAPDAVQNIIAGAQQPVTLSGLQSEFDGFDDKLINANVDAGIWINMQREFSELFVLRRGDMPRNSPAIRLERARQMVNSGDIAGAINQVAPMPGAAPAANWLQRARRYIATENALNVIERAALVPAQVPAQVPALAPVVDAVPVAPASPAPAIDPAPPQVVLNPAATPE